MLYDRANDWEKTKKQSQSGPKKVDDMRNDIINKFLQDEEGIRLNAEREEYSIFECQSSDKGGSLKQYSSEQQRYQENGGQGSMIMQGGYI